MRQDIHNSDIPALCRACEARHKGVCGALNTEQLIRLNKVTRQEIIKSGEELITEKEQNNRYANILRGVAKLSKLMEDGRQQIVGLQFAPDFLGRPFSSVSDVSIEAATELQLCTFPKKALEEIIKSSPVLEHKLHEQTLRELDEARAWMLTLGRKTASEKVANFVYLIATHTNPEENQTKNLLLELPLKRSEISDFLGLTIETVSRQLTKLRKADIIEMQEGRKILVKDFGKLYHACGH